MNGERSGWCSVWIDLSPLRKYRDFRLLFFGQAVSYFGSMMTYVAIPYQAPWR